MGNSLPPRTSAAQAVERDVLPFFAHPSTHPDPIARPRQPKRPILPQILLCVHRVGRNQRHCQKRRRATGKKPAKLPSPFYGYDPTWCEHCDGGKHRACARLRHCWARKRSPPGVNKKEQDRAARRKQRAEAAAERAHRATWRAGMRTLRANDRKLQEQRPALRLCPYA